jgi:hypothetical protein
MLPIALSFKLFGVGLLQARVVMIIYLIASILVFFQLAKSIQGDRFAFLASALLVTSPGVSLIEYGRQVLGEVPGIFFIINGLLIWFSKWEKSSIWRLFLVGLLFGLGIITKYQYLIIFVPVLGLTWIANLFYYRTVPQRVILIPSIVSILAFGSWQLYSIIYLGPSTAIENFSMLREAASGAALVLSTDLMRRGISEVLSAKVYIGALIPSLIYGFFLILPKNRIGQRWSILYMGALINLIWYLVASISWLRYAFLGLTLSALFVAKFFYDILDGYKFVSAFTSKKIKDFRIPNPREALQISAAIWLIFILFFSLFNISIEIITSDTNYPQAMANYLDENIPVDTLIETWEPEMGFLTDHNFHYPQTILLTKAIEHIWLEGPPVSSNYDYVELNNPDYILIGEFAKWVELYPLVYLNDNYKLSKSIGPYDLFVHQNYD